MKRFLLLTFPAFFSVVILLLLDTIHVSPSRPGVQRLSCISDWFTEWPAEALKGVATAMMTEIDLGLGESLGGIVEMFRWVDTHPRPQESSFGGDLSKGYIFSRVADCLCGSDLAMP